MRYKTLSISAWMAACALAWTPVSAGQQTGEGDLQATYLLDVPQAELLDFTLALPDDGKTVGSGHLLGTSDMTSVRRNAVCGEDPEMEEFLADYLGGNQYVCIMAQWAR